jgi:hypothetical protein
MNSTPEFKTHAQCLRVSDGGPALDLTLAKGLCLLPFLDQGRADWQDYFILIFVCCARTSLSNEPSWDHL